MKQKIFMEVGQKYGRLKVTDIIDTTYVEVVCDCGTTKKIKKYYLTRSEDKCPTRSCGCLQREATAIRNKKTKGTSTKPHGHSALTILIKGYKQGAKSRGMTFDLTRKDVKALIHKECHYCGRKDLRCIKTDAYYYYCNGIDRVDSDLGYFLGNVVPCCHMCNRAKYTHTSEEFIQMCKLVYLNHKD